MAKLLEFHPITTSVLSTPNSETCPDHIDQSKTGLVNHATFKKRTFWSRNLSALKADKMLGRQKLIFLAKTSRALSTSAVNHSKFSYQFVVVGGGAGGLSIASSLSRTFGKGKTAVIEPSEVKYMYATVKLFLYLNNKSYYLYLWN